MLEVIMHLFQCTICKAPMATAGRNKDGRCLYCSEVFRSRTDEQARAAIAETEGIAKLKYGRE